MNIVFLVLGERTVIVGTGVTGGEHILHSGGDIG